MEYNYIGADHEFHDKAFAQGWTDRFVPTPERIRLFDLVLSELQSSIPADGCIVELGIGPGYLADHILSVMPYIRYIGIDISRPMLEIANNRLHLFLERLELMQADLIRDNWETIIKGPVSSIVSTWALHDLASQEKIFDVYKKANLALSRNGLLLNGDFIKPEETQHEYEGGRFEISRHVEMLEEIGFKDASCLALFERETVNPTAAQNYACIKAKK